MEKNSSSETSEHDRLNHHQKRRKIRGNPNDESTDRHREEEKSIRDHA